MAHHNRTPRTVLDAPVPTATWMVHHRGPNRAARRHWRTLDGAVRYIPKGRQAPAYNEPYVRSASNVAAAMNSIGSAAVHAARGLEGLKVAAQGAAA